MYTNDASVFYRAVVKTDKQLKNADIGHPILPVSEYFLQFRDVRKQETLPFMYVVVQYLG